MHSFVVVTCLAVLVVLAGVQQAAAKPYRMKRTSDQHLADVETRVGLKNVKGIVVTVPVASGAVDPRIIGRKRRSQSRIFDVLFNHSSEEDTGDPEIDLDDLLLRYRLNLL